MIIKAVAQTIAVLALLAVLLFALAGTLYWPGAYVLLAALGTGGLIMTLWLVRKDPVLLKDRMRFQNTPRFDGILLPLLNLFLLVWIGAMAIEVRWHGVSQMPAWANLAAGAVVLAAFLLVVRVLKENTFATSIVKSQPERGQKVISSGPYAVVRHPMYSAVVLGYAAIPFALGSVTGVAGAPIAILLLAMRILFEEKLLQRELPGYCDYMTTVRYRLVPFIW